MIRLARLRWPTCTPSRSLGRESWTNPSGKVVKWFPGRSPAECEWRLSCLKRTFGAARSGSPLRRFRPCGLLRTGGLLTVEGDPQQARKQGHGAISVQLLLTQIKPLLLYRAFGRPAGNP